MTRPRLISTPDDLRRVCEDLYRMAMPFRVTVQEGSTRSVDQNKLAWAIAKEVSHQRPDLGDPQQIHAFNKLHFGVAIRKEDDDFREKYDRIIRPLAYEVKLELMAPPIDFPVTRDMGVRQMTRFLDAVWQHWTTEGVTLTQMEDA